ncbi:MAG: prepilin-type N-terminal cleavage/methylation domain-containing protein [Candidatus Colwellbacteria bacterium]|nr:prepilin-type N-terminal cleavage/methylation domain-containing protein [Candidatus Colwellbacteria bacterium]MBI3274170.1 prepilin-type N-terminal cleavage/methylation domain-containing protein [Candidatus Colwellbacteria bacterium]
MIMFKSLPTKSGFSLIELIVAVTILAVLTSVAIFSINPGGYLARGRDAQRKSDLITILNGVGQRIADNKGTFETGCAAGAIPTTSKKMAIGAGNYDISPCLVAAYLPTMPYDPKTTGAHWTTVSDYDTGYNIFKDAVTGRVTVSAPGAELETISYTR